MTRKRGYFFPLLQVVQQSLADLVTEVEKYLITAFTGDFKSIGMEVKIRNVQANAFTDADTRSQKERQQGEIPLAGIFMIPFLGFCQAFTILNRIQQPGHLIDIQPDNCFFVDFWNIDQFRYISIQVALFVKVREAGADRGKFSGFAGFMILDSELIFCSVIERHMLEEHFQMNGFHFFQIFNCELLRDFILELRNFLCKEFKKQSKIIGIIDSCQDGSSRLRTTEIFLAEGGEIP